MRLNVIFEVPARLNILWTDIEKLLLALGAEVSEGRVRAVFHRPHPRKEIDLGLHR